MSIKINVLTIVGTRPEIIRLSSILKSFDKYFNHILVHTGQNYDYELNEIFFKDLGLRAPDYFLNSSDVSPIKTMANIMSKLDDLLNNISPDAVLILGDTNSCISSLVVKRKKIPLFHFEAGNRCFDQRVPEEINRKFIDHIADVNLTYSHISRDYLIKEGISPDLVIKVGSPMYEVINQNLEKINKSKILQILKLKKKHYILASVHREENVDNLNNLSTILKSLDLVSKKYNKKILVSLHPRTNKKIKEFNLNKSDNLIFHKPFNFTDYVKLQISSYLIISDSGTINEEASILKLRAINLRESHERPEADEEGTTIMTGIEENSILNGCSIILKQNVKELNIVHDYKAKNVSLKMVRLLQSYTHYINRVIWKKY